MAKIIVVDDDKVVRTIVEKTLSRAGHTVQVAVDGAKAVSMIENDRFDVAILDILLPGLLNGFKLIAKTKAVSSKIVVFAMTGHGKQSHQRKAMSLGADEFMVKPIKPQYLLDKVNEYLGIEKKSEPEESEFQAPSEASFSPPPFQYQEQQETQQPETEPEAESRQTAETEEESKSPFDFDFDFEEPKKKEAPESPPPPSFAEIQEQSSPPMKPEPPTEPKPVRKESTPEPRRPFLIFRAMSKTTQDEIISLGRTREMFKGSIVDVDISSTFFILKQGNVSCLAKNTPIFTMQVGDILGETILFPHKNAPLYMKLKANEDSKMLLISKKQLMRYLVTNRKVMVQFMGNCLTTLSEKYSNCLDIIEKI